MEDKIDTRKLPIKIALMWWRWIEMAASARSMVCGI
jgi:hypothetical protein